MLKRKANLQRQTILQIIPSLESGGAERGTVEIARALVDAGNRALVVSQGGRMVPGLEAIGAEHVFLPAASKNPIQIVRNIQALCQIIESRKVDIIHARSRAPAWSAFFAARKTGIPFVTTYQGIYSETLPLKRLYNSVMARGLLTIANSKFTATVVKERHGAIAKRIEVVSRGVDFSVFSAQNVSIARIQKIAREWQLDGKEKILLLPARLSRRKGQALLIEALAQLDLSGVPPIVCVFAGELKGRERVFSRLEQHINRHGLPQSMFRFPGNCEDMAAAYLVADIVLMPSIVPEAFGRVAAEAQAMGRPVIVSDIGAVAETVCACPEFGPDEITGWRVAPDSPEALAQAIGQVLKLSGEELVRIGERGAEFISKNYSVGKMTSATLLLYQELGKIHRKQE